MNGAAANATVHIRPGDVVVTEHCTHDRGVFSVRLDEHYMTPVNVYITGTLDEMRAFAAQIIKTADAIEISRLAEEVAA